MNAILLAAPVPAALELGAPGVLLAAIGLLVAVVPVGLLLREILRNKGLRTAGPLLNAVPKRSRLRASPA